MDSSTVVKPSSQKGSISIYGAGFAALVVITLAWFFIPALIIQPFKYQSPRGLMLAMAVRQYAPIATPLTLGAALILAIILWRKIRWWGKALLIVGMIFASAAAVMSRIDYFEWMFHPDSTPGFASLTDTKLDASEMVMAVAFNGDARAYPIREMAYHHIVNDTVGGVPIAVTY
jgi:hypothetical protein